jgi:hypothetical protein
MACGGTALCAGCNAHWSLNTDKEGLRVWKGRLLPISASNSLFHGDEVTAAVIDALRPAATLRFALVRVLPVLLVK